MTTASDAVRSPSTRKQATFFPELDTSKEEVNSASNAHIHTDYTARAAMIYEYLNKATVYGGPT